MVFVVKLDFHFDDRVLPEFGERPALAAKLEVEGNGLLNTDGLAEPIFGWPEAVTTCRTQGGLIER